MSTGGQKAAKKQLVRQVKTLKRKRKRAKLQPLTDTLTEEAKNKLKAFETVNVAEMAKAIADRCALETKAKDFLASAAPDIVPFVHALVVLRFVEYVDDGELDIGDPEARDQVIRDFTYGASAGMDSVESDVDSDIDIEDLS